MKLKVTEVKIHPIYDFKITFLVKGNCPHCDKSNRIEVARTLLSTIVKQCTACSEDFEFEYPVEYFSKREIKPDFHLQFQSNLIKDINKERDPNYFQCGYSFINSVFVYLASCLLEQSNE